MPAQSGSDAILRRMKRGYNVDLYRRRVALLREEVPDIELGSDWIVGFPGESEADYAATEGFLAELGFVQNYVFKYDPRPGTVAAEGADDVPVAIKKERNNRLLAACERVALRRMEAWIGRVASVHVEGPSPRRPGVVRGTSFHGLPVSFPGPASLAGAQASVRIGEASPFGLSGTLLET